MQRTFRCVGKPLLEKGLGHRHKNMARKESYENYFTPFEIMAYETFAT